VCLFREGAEFIVIIVPGYNNSIPTDAYSLEDWDGVDRHHFNAIVSAQDFMDTYFPVFEVRCVLMLILYLFIILHTSQL
jgi:hypothetical protein